MLFTSDLVASISPDNKRLRRFEKIELKAGESKEVTFTLSARDRAFYNDNNQLVAEKGDFILKFKDLKKKVTLLEDVAYDEPSKVRL